MIRRNTTPLVGVLAFLLFGCNPGTGVASPAATAISSSSPALVSLIPSVAVSPVAPVTAAPTDDSVHQAPDLEALIPDVIGGQTIHTFSFAGQDYVAQHPYPLLDTLTAAGVSPEDLSVAGGIADANFSLQVLRVAGADANLFIDSARAFGATFTEATVGGKTVLTPRPDLPEPSYSYVDGQVLYEAGGDPRLVAEFFSKLP